MSNNGVQHWRPAFAEAHDPGILVLYRLAFVSSMSTSSLLGQPRLVSVNLVSPVSTSFRHAGQLPFSLSLLYAFLLRQFFCSVYARVCS